jgi:hypothetical protein
MVEGAGGIVYVALQSGASGGHAQVAELDRGGVLASGWPATLRQAAISDLIPLIDRSVVVMSGDASGAGSGYLTLLGPGGQIRKGWPQKLPGQAAIMAGGGTIYASVSINNGSRLFAFGEDGKARPGWPVDLPGIVNNLVLGPDGWIYAFTQTGATSSLDAIRPDGSLAPGWPFTVGGSSATAIAFEPGGEIVAALSGTIVMFGQDGQPRPGWPKNRYMSIVALAVGPDGSIYATPSVVNGKTQSQVLAFNPDGTPKVGWRPFLPPPGHWISGLTFVADGTLYATLSHLDGTPPDLIVAIGPDGSQLASWPTTADSWGPPPVFAPDGTVYVLGTQTSGGTPSSIAAYNQKGPKAGWPQTVPAGGISLVPRADGSLLVGISSATSSQVIALSADGSQLP